MRIVGVDFTSRPSRRKPITVQTARLDGGRLVIGEAEALTDFAAFEALLARPGPWIAGFDFPFGQPRRFIETIRWPTAWPDLIAHVASMDRAAFRTALDAYRKPRAAGDKEHARAVDRLAGGVSPQKLYGVPVGLMFFEGAPRLLASGASIPAHGVAGDRDRIVVEAYPGVLARGLIGPRPYKNDQTSKQTPDQRDARRAMLDRLGNEAPARYGVTVDLSPHAADAMVADPGADTLDALLCAVQAAYAWARRDAGFGIPPNADPLEGWIGDPFVEARRAEAGGA